LIALKIYLAEAAPDAPGKVICGSLHVQEQQTADEKEFIVENAQIAGQKDALIALRPADAFCVVRLVVSDVRLTLVPLIASDAFEAVGHFSILQEIRPGSLRAFVSEIRFLAAAEASG
jgi:hypothetical protein